MWGHRIHFMLWGFDPFSPASVKIVKNSNVSGMRGVKNKTLPWRAAQPKGETQEWNWEKSHLIVLTVFERFPKWAVSQRVSLSLCEAESSSKSFSTMQACPERLPPNTDSTMVKDERQREEKKMLFFSVLVILPFEETLFNLNLPPRGYNRNGLIIIIFLFKPFFGSSPQKIQCTSCRRLLSYFF